MAIKKEEVRLAGIKQDRSHFMALYNAAMAFFMADERENTETRAMHDAFVKAQQCYLFEGNHYSWCAVYNEPAYPKGPCNCGAK